MKRDPIGYIAHDYIKMSDFGDFQILTITFQMLECREQCRCVEVFFHYNKKVAVCR